jgi:5-(carboxyamino)imidazole ribonucleotide synthase
LSASLPAALAAVPEAAVHLYGKSARPGRKLGHVTVVGHDLNSVRDRAHAAVAILRGDEAEQS